MASLLRMLTAYCCVGVYGGLVGSSLLLRTLDQLPAILIDKGFEVLLFTPSQDDDVRAHPPPPTSAAGYSTYC